MSKKILVIDDSKVMQMSVKHSLESAGYAVILADNGLEGAERELLEAWEAAPVDGVELTGVQYYSYFFLERYLP